MIQSSHWMRELNLSMYECAIEEFKQEQRTQQFKMSFCPLIFCHDYSYFVTPSSMGKIAIIGLQGFSIQTMVENIIFTVGFSRCCPLEHWFCLPHAVVLQSEKEIYLNGTAFAARFILKLLLFFGIPVQLDLASFRNPIFSEKDIFPPFLPPGKKAGMFVT